MSYNHVELVAFLISVGASVTLGEFLSGARSGGGGSVGVLTRCGDMAGDNDQDTPLHRCETIAVARILLENGAELNARNAEGQTVRRVAERLRVVRRLLMVWVCFGQPFDTAIEDEHAELIAMYEALGAEKTDAVAQEVDENGFSISVTMVDE